MTLEVLMILVFVAGIDVGALLLHLLRRAPGYRAKTAQPFLPDSAAQKAHRWWQRRALRVVGRRIALIAAPVLANALYASVAVSQESLHRIDPVIFVAFQMAILAPIAGGMLWYTRRASLARLVRQGWIGGLPLGVGFICVSLSLRTLGIVPTAMLTALDGIAASLISWLLFRQRQPLFTCLAAGCAGCGAFLLWWVAPGSWQADVLALCCGLLFTAYAFHVERSAVARARPKDLWAFFGGVFLSMALVTLALALCFGSWSSVNRFSLADLETLLYTSFAAVLIPVVISTMLLRALSAVTLAFCAILEPVISIAFAYTLGSLSLPLLGWLGAGSILLSVIVQAGAAAANRTPIAPEDDRVRDGEPASSEAVVGDA